ncbi:hypothetical protein R1flu_013132 [Riccia fluitans]|uniref:Uncharacterized protein n=1 Tax=Riccia fluitans TaxID=41844 RepID=A0ABD1XDS2_9MARC
MAPHSSRNLKTKEVKISHLTVANRKKMESWGLGGLFAVDWSGTYDNLLENLATKQKAGGPSLNTMGSRRNGPRKCGGRFTTFLRRVLEHHAWVAITNPVAPTPDWGDAVEKTVSRQIKGLGVCNKATCLGPYLVHLYSHFHEIDAKEKEDSKKRKASIQTVSKSDTKTELEDEKEPPKEIPSVFCEGEASGKLLEAFHVEIGSMTAEAVARNMKEMFVSHHHRLFSVIFRPWKEMVRNLLA